VRRLSGRQWDVMQRHWSPTTRLGAQRCLGE
jgi:hypothetical protein